MFHLQPKHSLKWIALVVVAGLNASFVVAQDTKSEPDVRQVFVEFVMKAYRAYERQDREALRSLCSRRSPHCVEYERVIQAQLALTANVKLTLKRILILK